MKLTQLIAVTAATLGLGLATVSVTQPTTASAKTRASKLVAYKPFTNRYVTGQRGFMYTDPTLTKRAHHLTNYKHTTFIADHQAIIKRSNGKRAVYTYIRTSNFKVGGWVWHGFLKNKHVVTTKPGTGTTTPLKSGSTSTGSQTTPQTQKFSLADYRASFLKYLNEERTKRGLTPLSESTQIDKIAQLRSEQLLTNPSHYDSNGNSIAAALFKENGLTYGGECIGGSVKNDGTDYYKNGMTSDLVAKKDVHQYIYEDEASDNGHRDLLLGSHNYVGMGATFTSDKQDDIDTVVDFG